MAIYKSPGYFSSWEPLSSEYVKLLLPNRGHLFAGKELLQQYIEDAQQQNRECEVEMQAMDQMIW